jgi:hypothetical protein
MYYSFQKIASMIPFWCGNRNDDKTNDSKSTTTPINNNTNPLTVVQNMASLVVDSISKMNVTLPSILLPTSTSFISNCKQKRQWKKEEEWVIVLPKTRISPGEITPVTVVGGIDLLVIASTDGRHSHFVSAIGHATRNWTAN